MILLALWISLKTEIRFVRLYFKTHKNMQNIVVENLTRRKMLSCEECKKVKNPFWNKINYICLVHKIFPTYNTIYCSYFIGFSSFACVIININDMYSQVMHPAFRNYNSSFIKWEAI